MTLTEFLTARLDEDEAAAKAAAAEDSAEWTVAKRAILAEWNENQQDSYGYDSGLGFALSAVIAVYSDHPDYDPGWAA